MGWSIIVRHRGWWLKVFTAGILVAFGDATFWDRPSGAVSIAVFCFALLAGTIAAKPSLIKSKVAMAAFLSASLYCLAIAYAGSFLAWTLFWIAAPIVALAPYASHCKDAWQWTVRLIQHGFASLVRPIDDMIRLDKVSRRRGKRKLNLAALMKLIGLPVVGSAVFVSLFAYANPVIDGFLMSLRMPSLDAMPAIRLVLWAILALVAWSFLRPARFKAKQQENSTQVAHPLSLPVATIQLSLLAFNLIFALQNGMDLAFLSGAMALPEEITLAQYAHRGAYPLIGTALLAGLFVIVTTAPGSPSAGDVWVRRLVVAWVVQNVVLVASSMVRTLDYIDAYSLTPLRIHALVWMALVGLGLALICVRMLRGFSARWLINSNVAAAGLVLTAFCFIDTAAICADWNTRHAREVGGRGAALDLPYLERLGPSALPAVTRLSAQPLPPVFAAKVTATKQALENQLIDQTTYQGAGYHWRGQLLARTVLAKPTAPQLTEGRAP